MNCEMVLKRIFAAAYNAEYEEEKQKRNAIERGLAARQKLLDMGIMQID